MLPLLSKVGLLSLSLFGFQVMRTLSEFLYENFLVFRLKKPVKLEEMGKWALITGATDGIGKAFALALARRGINIILVSRNRKKLNDVALAIESEYQVQTKIIEVDFTDGPEVYATIQKELWGIGPIGILINNVGMTYPHPEFFLELPQRDKIYSDIIKCNIITVTNMCKMVMPFMRERGKGVVINISSSVALMPCPLLTVHGASKAYIEKFSDDLWTEYEDSGIIIQCLMPGHVATKTSKTRKPSWISPTPVRYVNSAIKTIGIKAKTTGYLPHALLVHIVELLEAVSPRLPRYIMRTTMESLRQQAIDRYIL